MDELLELAKSINTHFNHQNKELSRLDTEISKLYHKLEFDKNNAVQLVKLAISLKDVLSERRLIKKQMGVLSSMRSVQPCHPININKLKKISSKY